MMSLRDTARLTLAIIGSFAGLAALVLLVAASLDGYWPLAFLTLPTLFGMIRLMDWGTDL